MDLLVGVHVAAPPVLAEILGLHGRVRFVELDLRFLADEIGDQHSVTVRLKFDPSVSPWLEERRFPGVTNVETLEDGSKLYTIQTGVDSSGLPRELIPWIRGWGANVEVLEPPALREKWLVDARDLIARHGRI